MFRNLDITMSIIISKRLLCDALVNRLQCSSDGQVILQLDRDALVREGLKDRKDELRGVPSASRVERNRSVIHTMVVRAT